MIPKHQSQFHLVCNDIDWTGYVAQVVHLMELPLHFWKSQFLDYDILG